LLGARRLRVLGGEGDCRRRSVDYPALVTETLWGVLIGGVLGISGTILAGRFATGDERRRRRRDHEIKQIATTTHILDLWEAVAMAKHSGDRDQLIAAQEALRATDTEWDWSVDLIPGGRELRDLARGMWIGIIPEDPNDPFALSTRLMELQSQVRANASKRTREPQ
jgi:hypothetical protein